MPEAVLWAISPLTETRKLCYHKGDRAMPLPLMSLHGVGLESRPTGSSFPIPPLERRCWANCPCNISFQDFQPMWSQSTNVKALSTMPQKSATVAEFRRCLAVFGDSRTFLRQCGQGFIQMDRLTTHCDRKTALCTIVHRPEHTRLLCTDIMG